MISNIIISYENLFILFNFNDIYIFLNINSLYGLYGNNYV